MDLIQPIIIGIVAGYLSGQLGIGGGFIMQPALRIVIGVPALVSVGTPIPVIIISALTGAYNYYRSGYIDKQLALYLSVSGVISTVIGSYATKFVNGEILLLITAIVFMAVAARYIFSRASNAQAGSETARGPKNIPRAASIVGFITGFYSGFLGLGGGFLLVPALSMLFKKDMKTSLGTSLLVIIAYAIPSAVVHFFLGHVDLRLAVLLAVGIIPGAYLGSKVAIGLPDIVLRRLFGIFLFIVALYFAVFEVRVLFGG